MSCGKRFVEVVPLFIYTHPGEDGEEGVVLRIRWYSDSNHQDTF